MKTYVEDVSFYSKQCSVYVFMILNITLFENNDIVVSVFFRFHRFCLFTAILNEIELM